MAPIPPSGVDDGLFLCDSPGCSKRFKRKVNLLAHQALHHGERPLKCAVKGCSATYIRHQHLVRHQRVSHDRKPGQFSCGADGCVVSFDTKLSLRQHFRRVHYRLKAEKEARLCKMCNKEFSSQTKLEEHKRLMHRLTCSKCGTLYKKSKGQSSSCISGVNNSWLCRGCDLVFRKEKAGFVFSVNGKKLKRPWNCENCTKSFTTEGRLRIHQEIHDPDKPQFNCTIENCTRKFKFIRNLRSHIKMKHERVEIPKCPNCNREFSTKQKLTNHIKVIHDPEYDRKQPSKKLKSVRETTVKMLSGKIELNLKPWKPSGKRKDDMEASSAIHSDLKISDTAVDISTNTSSRILNHEEY